MVPDTMLGLQIHLSIILPETREREREGEKLTDYAHISSSYYSPPVTETCFRNEGRLNSISLLTNHNKGLRNPPKPQPASYQRHKGMILMGRS